MTALERLAAAAMRAYIENQEHTRKDDTLKYVVVFFAVVIVSYLLA